MAAWDTRDKVDNLLPTVVEMRKSRKISHLDQPHVGPQRFCAYVYDVTNFFIDCA